MSDDTYGTLNSQLFDLNSYLSDIDRFIYQGESSWNGNPISYVQSRIDLKPAYKERALLQSQIKKLEAKINKHTRHTQRGSGAFPSRGRRTAPELPVAQAYFVENEGDLPQAYLVENEDEDDLPEARTESASEVRIRLAKPLILRWRPLSL